MQKKKKKNLVDQFIGAGVGWFQDVSLQLVSCSSHFTAKAACLIMPAQWPCHNQLHIMG